MSECTPTEHGPLLSRNQDEELRASLLHCAEILEAVEEVVGSLG